MTTDQHPGIPGHSEGIELLPMLRPYVRHCGEERRPAWRIGNRRLLDFLLVYIEEGEGRFAVGGTEYSAVPGDLFWIPPDVDHAMEGWEPGMLCPYVHFDLTYRFPDSHWDFSIPQGMTDLTPLRPLMHPPITHPVLAQLCGKLSHYTNDRVGMLIHSICAEAARARPYAQVRMSGLLTEALAEILRGAYAVNSETDEHIPALEKAARLLCDAACDGVTVEEAATVADLSPSHFRRLFAHFYGCAPRTYLRNARIQRAKQLMVGSSLTLSEIAREAGFATVHSFSRAFRHVEGVSPSQYRQFGREVSTRVSARMASYHGAQDTHHER